ncbi:hypothetical protein BGX34_005157 [Mortierella sp. NVP85]|nr:hypothetical protein BGX34_005157 [Mortierella sp. NVP85]
MAEFHESKVQALCDDVAANTLNPDIIADDILLQGVNDGDQSATSPDEITQPVRNDLSNITIHCAIDIYVFFAYIPSL